jgi:hypothetical protein
VLLPKKQTKKAEPFLNYGSAFFGRKENLKKC